MIAILDADALPYRVAAVAEKHNFTLIEAKIYLENLFCDLIYKSGCEDYVAFISGKDNYRNKVSPSYKQNRDYSKTRKNYYYDLRGHMYRNFNVYEVRGAEADDACYSLHAKYDDSVIISNDKDLLQSPGYHYNYTKSLKFTTNREGGIYVIDGKTYVTGLTALYYQMLVGDSADNIKGVYGIGPVNAKRLLEGKKVNEMFRITYDEYVKSYQKEAYKYFLNNLKLLKMRMIDISHVRLESRPLWKPPTHGGFDGEDSDLLVSVSPFSD